MPATASAEIHTVADTISTTNCNPYLDLKTLMIDLSNKQNDFGLRICPSDYKPKSGNSQCRSCEGCPARLTLEHSYTFAKQPPSRVRHPQFLYGHGSQMVCILDGPNHSSMNCASTLLENHKNRKFAFNRHMDRIPFAPALDDRIAEGGLRIHEAEILAILQERLG
jgi:hypothetical protein